jgi:hypothetical protein
MDELNFFSNLTKEELSLLEDAFWKFRIQNMMNNLNEARIPLAWYDSDLRYLAQQVEEDYEVFIENTSEEIWNSQKNKD